MSKKEFANALKKLGLRLEQSDIKKLIEILDLDGSGEISYQVRSHDYGMNVATANTSVAVAFSSQEFVSFFNNNSSKGSWYDDEPELARKIKSAVLKGSKVEGVFGFRDDSKDSDEGRNGHNDVADFRKNILRNLKVKLSEREVSKLAIVLDSKGDGYINYKPVISYMIGCLPPLSERLPDEFQAIQVRSAEERSDELNITSSFARRLRF